MESSLSLQPVRVNGLIQMQAQCLPCISHVAWARLVHDLERIAVLCELWVSKLLPSKLSDSVALRWQAFQHGQAKNLQI